MSHLPRRFYCRILRGEPLKCFLLLACLCLPASVQFVSLRFLFLFSPSAAHPVSKAATNANSQKALIETSLRSLPVELMKSIGKPPPLESSEVSSPTQAQQEAAASSTSVSRASSRRVTDHSQEFRER